VAISIEADVGAVQRLPRSARNDRKNLCALTLSLQGREKIDSSVENIKFLNYNA